MSVVFVICFAAPCVAIGLKGLRDVYLHIHQDSQSWMPVACAVLSVPLMMVTIVAAVIGRPQFTPVAWLGDIGTCLLPSLSVLLLFL